MDLCPVCLAAKPDMSFVDHGSSRVLKRKEVLRFMRILASPMGHKAAEQGLLQWAEFAVSCDYYRGTTAACVVG